MIGKVENESTKGELEVWSCYAITGTNPAAEKFSAHAHRSVTKMATQNLSKRQVPEKYFTLSPDLGWDSNSLMLRIRNP